ncbi:hypothetical protein [Leptospira tipperaryensis]|nr:hypothetical protein [Leptospira tipperaryensis]
MNSKLYFLNLFKNNKNLTLESQGSPGYFSKKENGLAIHEGRVQFYF